MPDGQSQTVPERVAPRQHQVAGLLFQIAVDHKPLLSSPSANVVPEPESEPPRRQSEHRRVSVDDNIAMATERHKPHAAAGII